MLHMHFDVELVVSVVFVVLVLEVEFVVIVWGHDGDLRRRSRGRAVAPVFRIAGVEGTTARDERSGGGCKGETPVHATSRR